MSRLRDARTAAGLSQADLAARAGVSRQMVGAIEAGRHLPRVDAALALAAALGAKVGDLFGTPEVPVDALTGGGLPEGSTRVGRVGDRLVGTPARSGADGWGPADGILVSGTFEPWGRLGTGLVVAGCEPGLELLERLLRESGRTALAVPASSAAAREALAAGRLHAAVVHGPEGASTDAPPGVVRIHVARWRVGLAAPRGADADWWRRALAGEVAVVQREAGAGVQAAFEAAVGAPVGGPVVGGHLAAVAVGSAAGLAAVTIEPAAFAAGVEFHPLGVHRAELWVDDSWAGDRVVADALDVLTSRAFLGRLAIIGGYDLTRSGERAA